VVAARSGHLDAPPREVLAANVEEVGILASRRPTGFGLRASQPGHQPVVARRLLPSQQRDALGQRRHTEHVHPVDQPGLRCVGDRHDNALDAVVDR